MTSKKSVSKKKHETKTSISTWAEKTFGKSTLPRTLAAAIEEHANLMRKLTMGYYSNAALTEQIADVAIVCARAATKLKMNVDFDALAGPDDPLLFASMVGVHLNKAVMSDSSGGTVSGATGTHLFRAFGGLAKLAHLHEAKLQDAVDQKMQVNYSHKWNNDGSGHGYWLVDKEADADTS